MQFIMLLSISMLSTTCNYLQMLPLCPDAAKNMENWRGFEQHHELHDAAGNWWQFPKLISGTRTEVKHGAMHFPKNTRYMVV